MIHESGFNEMDWRIMIYREQTVAHLFGKISLSDRYVQSACGEVDYITRADLSIPGHHSICPNCKKLIGE